MKTERLSFSWLFPGRIRKTERVKPEWSVNVCYRVNLVFSFWFNASKENQYQIINSFVKRQENVQPTINNITIEKMKAHFELSSGKLQRIKRYNFY